jgi:hypothetical protein
MTMIDNGFCFKEINWNFPNSPILGLYHERNGCRDVRGTKCFEAWLGQLEVQVCRIISSHMAATRISSPRKPSRKDE